MANNRLFIGNTKTKDWMFCVSGFGDTWTDERFDGDFIKRFICGAEEGACDRKTKLVFFTENDSMYDWFKSFGSFIKRDETNDVDMKDICHECGVCKIIEYHNGESEKHCSMLAIRGQSLVKQKPVKACPLFYKNEPKVKKGIKTDKDTTEEYFAKEPNLMLKFFKRICGYQK